MFVDKTVYLQYLESLQTMSIVEIVHNFANSMFKKRNKDFPFFKGNKDICESIFMYYLASLAGTPNYSAFNQMINWNNKLQVEDL